MKKRTKISLRTKIYLTIVGLLALTGIIYAANPVTFSTFPGLTGVAVSKTEMFATGYAGSARRVEKVPITKSTWKSSMAG